VDLLPVAFLAETYVVPGISGKTGFIHNPILLCFALLIE